ncbi:hypothetical protein [Neorhizobium galegae]|uniref:hypothetical protein n=1 Tax=Neorhizobium galegae TaxID=399 RepID=UPI000621C75C|nr:hypothetical protein [Neorhizobium galegae]CDZ55114.1 Hypothetical protein NGAL_HAMBI2427_60130 [Neorhizobium galegae bv. orientalis]
MAEKLPIAFATFKRCVLETLINGPLPVRVERHAERWSVLLKSQDGQTEIHVPPNKEMITSEEAARGFAKAALQLALDEFEAERLDAIEEPDKPERLQ